MKKKLAVIFIYKFNLSDYYNWNFKKLKKIFDVTFFDLSEIFLENKIIANSYKINSVESKFHNYYTLKNLQKLDILIKDFDYILDYTNLYLNYNYKKNKISNFLKVISFKNSSRTITILTGSLPNFFHHNLINKIKFFFMITYLILNYRKFYFFFFYIKKIISILKKNIMQNTNTNNHRFYYNYAMVSDIFWEKYVNLHFPNSKKIYIHYKDFERYLFYKNTKKFKFKRYVIFLDEDIFDHPDFLTFYNYQLFKGKNLNDLKFKYYSMLNNFFNNFERHTGYKVIIAAHPKTVFTKKNNYFDNRTYIKNNTFDLVSQSSGVFAHCSTSISIAILFNKPITLLFGNIMFDLGYTTKILSMFFETKARLVDMNSKQVNYSDLIIKNKKNLNKSYIKKYINSSIEKKKIQFGIIYRKKLII